MRNNELTKHLNDLKTKMAEKEEDLAITNSDKVRFKDLSEGYMKEVARLEAQLEAADIKPKSKLSQRPKDTVMRDQSHSLSNIHAQRVKSVEAKQLTQTVLLLKLILQKYQLQSDSMSPLLFAEDYDPSEELTIVELRQKFESLGIQAKRSTLMARFLIEPSSQGEIIYNENLRASKRDVLLSLQRLIGPYHLFAPEDSPAVDDPDYIQEVYMQKLILENFGRYRETLIEALKLEDSDEEEAK